MLSPMPASAANAFTDWPSSSTKRETAVPIEPTATTAPERPARHRRERATEPTVDAEALIKQVVGKLQAQGNAEAERLRDAMRKVVAILQAAIGAEP